MSRRTKIIVIVLLVALILALLAFRFLRGRGNAPVATPTVPKVALSGNLAPLSNANSSQPTPTTTPAAPVEADPRPGIQRQAASFAERFGSYSNQGNFENITDLEVFMSQSMVAWAKQYVASARINVKTGTVYSGTTTRAIATMLSAYDATKGSATVVVKTQRREVAGQNSVERVYYQDMTVTFVKEAGVWKVDSATWQKQ